MIALYFVVALIATTVGSMTGMGGGVIIKPVLDFLGHYDVSSINTLSAITVFSMAVVSLLMQTRRKMKIDLHIAVPLALSAVVGGDVGQWMLKELVCRLDAGAMVMAVQNIVLALLIVVVMVYMRNKHRITPLGLRGVWPSLLVGVLLGIFSSFLGIGGGPINIALLIFVFSFDTRTATINSIIIILFSQASKLISLTFSTGFAPYDLTILPPMIIGAVVGGFCGQLISRRLSEKHLDNAFNAVQVFVLAACVVNIIKG